jgi:hypothetical protein
LIAWFVPSLAATLLDRERKKGAPLTRTEVNRVRDEAPAILVSRATLKELRKRRGYEDIDPANAWTEFQVLRDQLAQGDLPGKVREKAPRTTGNRGPEALIGRPFNRAHLDELLCYPDEAPKLDAFGGIRTLVHRRNGIDLHVGKRGRVITIFLYGKRFEGHQPYRKSLPVGLKSFRTSRAEVIKLLGRPTVTGRQHGARPAWIRYDLPKYVIHLELSDGQSSIDRITLMTHGAAKGELD